MESKRLVLLILLLGFGGGLIFPKEKIVGRIKATFSKPAWVRVNADFTSKTCQDFCKSVDKSCKPQGCQPAKLCNTRGGMMEIEIWDKTQGWICDRQWEGRCDALMDRYPPAYNFYCCCR